MNRVGDLMIIRMREEGVYSVLSRDGLATDVGTQLQLPMLKGQQPHPMNYADACARYLRRDSRFEKTRVRAHNVEGNPCILSCFTLKEEYR